MSSARNDSLSALGLFPTTQWSLIARAGAADGEGASGEMPPRQALGVLLRRYMPALRAHLASRRLRPCDIDDLIQGFIADKVIEKQLLACADKGRGRFRCFLRTALDNYAANQHRRATAERRAPRGAKILALDERHEPASGNDGAGKGPPIDCFDIAWAREVIAEAVRRMRHECLASGRSDLWEVFNCRILAPAVGQVEPLGYDQLVERLNYDEHKEAHNALTTAKRRFEGVLRAVVAEYAADPKELEDELRGLAAVLAAAPHVERSEEEHLAGGEPRLAGGGPAESPPPGDGSGLPRDAVPGYKLIREVGRGGQAVVYLATRTADGRAVAVSVMLGGPFAGSRERARFDREAQILAALDHPNITPVLDRGTTSAGAAFLVTEYVDGESLDKWAARRRGGDEAGGAATLNDIAEFLRLFVKVCDAVNAAHLRGIVHRDLKPSNILVTPDGEPHVIDFGLAHAGFTARTGDSDEEGAGGAPGPLTVTGQFLGSVPWASPEQAEGTAGKIDTRSDVYSLGVILYQVLTGGRFPYTVVGNVRDVLTNIITAEPMPPSKVLAARQSREQRRTRAREMQRNPIDPRVEAIVLKALRKRREDRYQTAGEFGRDVAAYLLGTPISARATLPRRRRLRVASATCVGAALLAAVAVGLPAHLHRRAQGGSMSSQVAAPGSAAPRSRTRPDVDAELVDGTLHVRGTDGPDGLRLRSTGQGAVRVERLGVGPDPRPATAAREFDPDDFNEIRVDLGTGADRLEVNGTCGKPLQVCAGEDDDWVSVAYSSQRLDSVRARIDVDGGGGTDNLELCDNGSRLSRTYRFGPGTFARDEIPGITYRGIEDLGVSGGSGDDVFELEATGPDTVVHIHAGAGDDTVFAARAGGRLEALHLDFSGHEGRDTLRLFDRGQTTGQRYTIDGGSLMRSGFSYDFTFGTIEVLSLEAGSGNDVVDASAVPATLSLALSGGGGTDELTGGAADDSLTGGPGADRFAGGPGRDTVSDFDTSHGDAAREVEVFAAHPGSAAPTSRTGPGIDADLAKGVLHVRGTDGPDALRLSSTGQGAMRVERLGVGPDPRPVTAAREFDPDHFNRIRVDLGTGADRLEVNDTCGKPLHVSAGEDDDWVTVAHSTQRLETVRARIDVDGGGGVDELELCDYGSRLNRIYRFGPGTFTRDDLPGITYRGIENLGMSGGSGDDVFEVEATAPGTVVHIHAGAGDDTVIVARAGGRLEALGGLDVSGKEGRDTIRLSDHRQTIGQRYTINGGRLTRSGLPYKFTFGTIETLSLEAGSGDDVIDASAVPATLSLELSGGGGKDELTGGAADDSLTGGPGADRFVGGPGRDTVNDLDLAGGDAAREVEVVPSSDGGS